MSDPRSAQALADARRDAVTRMDAATADLDAAAAAAAGSNADDEHDPEGSTLAFERQQLVAVRDQARRQLDEIDAALHRLTAGRYGVCEDCGGRIAAERLAALPAARKCVACAARV